MGNTPEPTPLREALVRWLFPKGLDHPGHWSLTNEGAREIARAALATPPATLAAERLRRDFAASVHDPYFAIEGPLLLDAALAAERKATVKRIREVIETGAGTQWGPETPVTLWSIYAVLDAEAER